MTRLVWLVNPGDIVQPYMIQESLQAFHDRNPGIRPTVIRLSFKDYFSYCSGFSQNIALEKGKVYGNYIITPFGPLLIDLMDDSEIASHSPNSPYGQQTAFFVESDELDKEFEKHVLNKED